MNLDLARSIIVSARAFGAEHGLHPLSVAVLDAGGQLRAFEREDGSSNARFEIARAKAYGALAFGIGSRGIGRLAEQRPAFLAGVTAAIGGGLVPAPGGVLVTSKNGEVLGAVGISGDSVPTMMKPLRSSLLRQPD